MRLRNKKTGKLYEWCSIMVKKNRKSVKLLVAEKEDDDREIYYYESFEKMCEEWETVEDPQPKEPYIKDEKNRKVVRAWLEANDLDGATFHTSSHFFHYWNLRGFNDNGQGVDIDFFLTGEGIPNLIDGKYYTKLELCGEETE